MGNRAQRVQEQIQKQGILENSVLESLGGIDDNAAVAKQGRYVKALLNEVITEKGADACRKIMRPCGQQCISDSIIKKAKELYQKSECDLPGFLGLMNDNHIGGGKLRMDGDFIIGAYDTCYCGLPKTVRNFPKEYCECSAGWYERLFSEVFEKNVTVEVLQTILSGSEQCTFRVTV